MYDVDPANIWQIKDFFQSEIISNAQKVAESSQSPTLRQLFELKNLHESSSSTLALIQNLFYSPFEVYFTKLSSSIHSQMVRMRKNMIFNLNSVSKKKSLIQSSNQCLDFIKKGSLMKRYDLESRL